MLHTPIQTDARSMSLTVSNKHPNVVKIVLFHRLHPIRALLLNPDQTTNVLEGGTMVIGLTTATVL